MSYFLHHNKLKVLKNIAITAKLTKLTYPNEYGNGLTPQPDIIYDTVPPIAVRLINTDEIPIASIIENPNIAVKIRIINTPATNT